MMKRNTLSAWCSASLVGMVLMAGMSLCYELLPSFGIVYATKSKMVLRIILPDTNEELYHQPLRSGETVLVVGHSSLEGDARECGKRVNLYACEHLVAAATGVRPLKSRHAVIENGRVIAVDHIEPNLDGHEVWAGKTLIQSDIASVGMSYDPVRGFKTP